MTVETIPVFQSGSNKSPNVLPHVESYKGLRQEIQLREQRKFDQLQLKDFTFLTANLERFLPHIPASAYEDIYLKLLYGRALLNEETGMPELIDRLDVVGAEAALAPENFPAVICTYHLGSYRSVIGIVASKGLDFVLIVDENTYHRQGDSIRKKVAEIHKAFGVTAFFDLLNAESPNIAMTLSKCLYEGKSIIAYIDGNTGGGGIFHKSEQFHLRIPFFGQEINSRKGIAAISWMNKRPIIPVISYYPDEERKPPKVLFLPKIDPKEWAGAPKEYIPEVTRKLYSELEKYLIQYYDQWETWLYLHKYLPPGVSTTRDISTANYADLPANTQLKFNKTNFGLFMIENDCFLLNKRTYQCFQLTEPCFKSLFKMSIKLKQEMEEEGFESIFIRDLLNIGVLEIHK
ncbi:MAG: hypothetical protein SH848_03870 [Saprospiraceae bacterium]|nr:hypothetical protein [Saprospiraceae bacterium]